MSQLKHRVHELPAGSGTKTLGVGSPGRSRILTINGGSSSLKFALFERTDPSARLLSGRVDRIGLENARWVMAQADGGRKEDRPVDAPDQKAAVHLLIDWLEARSGSRRSPPSGIVSLMGGVATISPNGSRPS